LTAEFSFSFIADKLERPSLVREFRLHPSTRLVEAEWLRQRLHSFGSGVASVVPDDFPAYIRILHPPRGGNNEPLHWADVAARSGRTMHRLVQFHAIERSLSSTEGDGSVPPTSPPESGNLSADLLSAICAILAGHTAGKDSCWFCLWEGYGFWESYDWLRGGSAASSLIFTAAGNTANDAGVLPVAPSRLPGPLPGARVSLPNRNYLLFEGPLDAATEFGWTMPGGSFVPQSPNLFWPHDHSWCVASEIDLFCTLVAGSETLAETLLADKRLEAWRVFPGDPVSWDSDKINT
jgi:hypothetical protein